MPSACARNADPKRRRTSVSLAAVAVWCCLAPLPGAARAGVCDPAPGEQVVPSAPPPKRFHYVFVVDTSASMMGKGDGRGRVIFPRVKEEIRRFLDRVPAGSTVTFQPFDRGPGASASFLVPDQRPQLDAYLRALEAKGKDTYLYASLLDVFRRLPQDPSVATVVFLFTDGNDNDPGPLTMEDVARTYKLRRGPYDWLYYFFLGLDVPEDVQRAVEHEEGWFLMSAPPNEVPRLMNLTVEPARLDLGNLLLTPEVTRRMRFALDVEAPVSLRVRTVAPEVAAHGATLSLQPTEVTGSGQNVFRFHLLDAEALPHGEYDAVLCVDTTDRTAAVRPVPVALKFRYQPAGTYALKAVYDRNELKLAPGETVPLLYRLEGDPWATQAVRITPPAPLPEGLAVRLNGQSGPVTLAPGEELRVDVFNGGMLRRSVENLALGVALPGGASGPERVVLPPVQRPVTWWEWLWDWWWLWLALLLLLLFLLFLGFRRWQAANRTWGVCTFQSAPPECKEFSAPLKGGAAVDLGQVLGREELRGLQIAPRPQGYPIIKRDGSSHASRTGRGWG